MSSRPRIDRVRVAELTLAGWPVKRIARELGCAKGTVCKIRVELGIAKVYREPIPHASAGRIVVMTKAGWSTQRIAASIGCDGRTVTRIRVRAGIAQPAARRLTTAEIDQAEQLFADGCSISEVERTLGRSQGSLARRFKGRGWTHQETSEFGAYCSAMAKRERKRA